MCGIAGIHLMNPKAVIRSRDDLEAMERFVDELFLATEHRGRDASGFLAVTTDNKMVLDKKPVSASQYIKVRRKLPEETRTVLLHCRFTTKGPESNFMNNHPVSYGSVFVTHNGMIHNDDWLFQEHNFKRYAEVDTEIISALLDKNGLDKPKDALKELSGSFAIAAVDPVRHPQKLLLAKGSNSPLYVHLNKNFLVWASTKDIINDAWGKIIGTPPSTFDSFGVGDVWMIEDDTVLKKPHEFQPASYSSNNGYYKTGNYTRSTIKSNSYSPIDYKEVVTQMRLDGMSRSYSWDTRKEMPADVLKAHNGKFGWCRSCRTSVVEIFLVQTRIWGQICVDCAKLALEEHGTAQIVLPINSAKIKELNEYAETHAYIHYKVLRAIGEQTGLSMHAVQYMLFLEDDLYENSSELGTTYALLLDLYLEEEEVQWSAWARKWAAESQQTQANPERTQSRWVSHSNGPTHKQEESSTCTECQAEASADTHPECITPAEREGRELEECFTQITEAVTKPVKSLDIGTIPNKCNQCRNKPVMYQRASDNRKIFGWCNKHLKKCVRRSCANRPVGSSLEGLRLCHHHFRGCKGGVLDQDERAPKLVLAKK